MDLSFSCNYCKMVWKFSDAQFKKIGSSTGNLMKHIKRKHNKQLQGNTAIGPMDGFLQRSSGIEKHLGSDLNVSDDLIRIALENFVISATEAFTIVESEAFLTLPKLCLK